MTTETQLPDNNFHVYKAFYFNKEAIVSGISSYQAYIKAVDMFQAPKSKRHMVHVHIVQRADGSDVIHSTASV